MSAMAAMPAMIAPVLHGSALPTLGSADDDIGVPAAHQEQISPLAAIEDVGVGAVAAGKKI